MSHRCFTLAVALTLSLLVARAAPQAVLTDTPQPPQPLATPVPRFPPDPQRIEFEAEDGVKLVGYYYPAAVEPAPVLVLMHWVGGSHCEWVYANLVQWLQNRGLPEGMVANPACEGVDARFTLPLAEYPPLPAGRSFAVFAFDYRGHGESGNAMTGTGRILQGWLEDSIAAVQTARTLPGVDPDRVATIGASIGADGAIDGCGEGCLGALSLSPGSYLGVAYEEAVTTLDRENKPAWCIVSRQDGESFPVCEAASGEHYRKIVYEQNEHGMSFFRPDLVPGTGQNILDFLLSVFGN
ncbi:MAG: hypothetical protein HY335_01965 [Deinococcus sp.]|nr:hypothetical protein [Deinococcus sp.]